MSAPTRSSRPAILRHPSPPDGAEAARGRAVTPRSVALAILLAVVVPLVGVNTVSVYGSGDPGNRAVSYFAVSVLLLLSLLNRLWRRIRPSWALSPAELLALYFVTALCATFCSYESLFMLVSVMVYPFRFASSANHWSGLFFDRLPRWAMVENSTAVHAFYEGGANLFTTHLYRAWLGPILWWTLFVTALVGAFLALDVLMARRWMAEERLAFPLVEIPLALAAPEGSRSRSIFTGWGWLGIGLSAGLHLWSDIADLYPIIPALPLAKEMASWPSRPWSALGYRWIFWAPETFGLAFLIPVELSLSLWVFSLFWASELILADTYWATVGSSSFPYVLAQTTGAYLGIAALVLWSARRHLLGIARRAFDVPAFRRSGKSLTAETQRTQRLRRETKENNSGFSSPSPSSSSSSSSSSSPSEVPSALPLRSLCLRGESVSPELVNERIAFWGLLACVGFLIWFAVGLGMRPGIAAAFVLLYLAFALTVTRLRAQVGVPFHDLHGVNPITVLLNTRGSGGLTTGDMVGFASFYWFNRTYRATSMPSMLEGIQGTTAARGDARRLPLLFLFCAFMAVTVTLWGNVFLMTRWGAATAHVKHTVFIAGSYSNTPWSRLGTWLQSGYLSSLEATIAMGIGFAASLALAAISGRFLAWPFHPVALAISSSIDAFGYLIPLFTAWLAKTLVLRYGGLPLYRRGVQFATGLIVGWAIVAMLSSLVLGPLLG